MPGHKRTSGRLITRLGREGKKVNIVPTTRGLNLTELYGKAGLGLDDYLGSIAYCPEWKKYVLTDMPADMQMSKECIDEAFQMVEDYWGDRIPDADALPDTTIAEVGED